MARMRWLLRERRRRGSCGRACCSGFRCGGSPWTAAEHGLDAPAVLVAALIVLDGPLAVATTGDDGDRSLLAERRAQAVGVVSPVGDDALHAGGCVDQQLDALDVGGVARRQREAERPPEAVDERMDLRRPPATRDANGICPRPPPPLRRRSTGAPSHNCCRSGRSRRSSPLRSAPRECGSTPRAGSSGSSDCRPSSKGHSRSGIRPSARRT